MPADAFWSLTPGITLAGAPCRRTGANLDTLLLAALVAPQPGQRLVELGTGCGGVALIVARRSSGVWIDALEVQPRLADLARANLRRNGLEDRMRVLTGDLRQPPDPLAAGGYHHLFFNPPFHAPGRGRLPPDPLRAAARFELHGALEQFIAQGAELLVPGGVCHLIHRPERLAAIKDGCGAAGLGLLRVYRVRRRPGEPVLRILVQARRGGNGSRALYDDLVLATAADLPTPPAARMAAGQPFSNIPRSAPAPDA
ncbi:MAG: methyltransferase [Magnetococcales bacterium]|nr:methyltransferase [Magnetococcales bacterium]